MTTSPGSTRLTAGLILASAMLDAALFYRLVVLPESSQAIAVDLTIHALLAVAGAYELGSCFGRAEDRAAALALAAFWALFFMPIVAGPGLFVVLAVGTRASEPARVNRRIGLPLSIRWDNAELKPRLPIRQATPERIADNLDARSSDLAPAWPASDAPRTPTSDSHANASCTVGALRSGRRCAAIRLQLDRETWNRTTSRR